MEKKKRDDCGVQFPRCCILRCCVGVGGHLSDESLKEKGQGTHCNPTIEYYLTTSTNLSICRLLTVRVLILLWNKANVGEKTFNSQGIANWMLVPLVSVLFCPDLVDPGGRSRHCLSKSVSSRVAHTWVFLLWQKDIALCFSAPSSSPLSSNGPVRLDHKPLCRFSPLRSRFGSE